MKTNVFLALLLTFCILLPALAQTKPAPQKTDDDDDVVKITTNLVQVDAVVTKNGKPVTDLTADDFEIYEDGKKQTITSFAYVSNVPGTTSSQPATTAKKGATIDAAPVAPVKRDDPRRIMALVVDDLGMSAESMELLKKQLRKFVVEQMQPNDLVAIIRTGGELGALQQFTNDKRVLNRAVDRLRWNFCSRVGFSVFPALASPLLSSQCGGRSYTQTMRALRFILDAMGELPGRKSMALFSDSLPQESQEIEGHESFIRVTSFTNYSGILQRIAEKAIRSSVVIYSVDTQGLQYTGPTAADKIRASGRTLALTTSELMSARSNLLWDRRAGGELIARQTGGFQVYNSNSFKLDRILEDQSGYYLLGYRPTDETFNRRFHHIKAKVKRSGMTLRTRYGFFGISEEDVVQRPISHRDSTNLALASPFRAQDIEVDLTSFFTHDTIAGLMVRSFVYIDAKGLTFERAEGRHQASIELHGVVFGDNGTVAHQRAHGATLSLNDSDYAQAMRNGMALRFDLPVKRAGSYQVRIAARDRASSKIGTAGEFVEVPDLNKKFAVSGIVLGTTAGFAGRDVAEIIENPGTRSFETNSDLHFAFVAYNATSANTLVMETRLFRDGKQVYSGPEVPMQVGNQTDPNRLLVNGSVRLGPDLEAGDYYLQVVITDKSAKGKVVPAVQWIDFEIEK